MFRTGIPEDDPIRSLLPGLQTIGKDRIGKKRRRRRVGEKEGEGGGRRRKREGEEGNGERRS